MNARHDFGQWWRSEVWKDFGWRSASIEEAWQSFCANPNAIGAVPMSYTWRSVEYRIDFNQMTQRNTETNNTRKVRRFMLAMGREGRDRGRSPRRANEGRDRSRSPRATEAL
jgi:hypothetical protein